MISPKISICNDLGITASNPPFLFPAKDPADLQVIPLKIPPQLLSFADDDCIQLLILLSPGAHRDMRMSGRRSSCAPEIF